MKKISKHLILCVIFFLLSFAITVQVRITNDSESKASQEKTSAKLKDKIFELNDESDRLKKMLGATEKNLYNIRIKAAENDSSNTEKSELIKKYIIMDGSSSVKGPGVIVRLYPNERKQDGTEYGSADITKDLIDIVNELKNAGAEALSVNEIRITGNSSIEMEKNSIVVDGNKINSPFVIKSIGNSEMMNSSLIRPGGTIELIRSNRARIELAISKNVKITKTIGI